MNRDGPGITPHDFLRDLEAAKGAARQYDDQWHRLAEVAADLKVGGMPLAARKFAHRAEIARRAYVAEINDPDPR